MNFLNSRFNRLAALLSFYLMIITLIVLKNFETMGNRIDEYCSKEPQVVEVPQTRIEYREIITESTEQEFMDMYMSLRTDDNAEEWFKMYKEMLKDSENPPATIYDVYTEEEIALWCKMVQTEIGSGDFMSKARIASVVLNRIDSEEFPDTIKAVITAPNQFAVVNKRVDETTILSVEYAFMFQDITDGAVAFHSGKPTEVFFGRQNLHLNDQYHSFYK